MKRLSRSNGAVRGGDIIMFRTWLDHQDNVPVKQILAQAARR
jgi:hypothetical protein